MKTNANSGDRFVEELNLYQAANTDDKTLKTNFVVRVNEFDTIVNVLKRTQPNDSLQHELILGARGSGKSTLLKRIEIELKENKELNKKYISINFAEEQAGIFRLADLWYEIINELEPDIELQNFSDFEDNHSYTRYLYGVLNKLIREKKKKVVVLLDNFDKIIESIKEDAKVLRAALINDNNIQIVAASTRMSEHFWKHDMPFYDFFRIHRLKPLSLQEIDTLLKHWGKIMNLPILTNYTSTHRGNIEAIRILTDGLPRTLQFFIRILLSNDEKFDAKYINYIMDKATPIYQERLWSLTKAQQKIVLETAFFWKPVSTKELVNLCRMESKLVASYLKQLEQYGIIKKLKTENRKNKYQIAERFFNMWLIATQGNPEQRRKAIYLTLFLEYWYNKDELKVLAKQHLENVKSKKIGFEKASILTKAISQSKHIGIEMRDALIENTLQIREQAAYYLPKKAETILKQIEEFQKEGKINEALKLANKIENEEDGEKFFVLALLYGEQDKYKEAEKYYLMAVEKGHTGAANNLALIYTNQDKYKEAEKYYLMAIENGHENAMNNLGLLYETRDKYKEAEKYYLMAVEKGHTGAMNNLAIIYIKQEKYKEAESYYKEAVNKGVEEAFFNLAFFYFELNKNRKKALELTQNIKSDKLNHKAILFIIEIWNGIFNDVSNRMEAFVDNLPIEMLSDLILFLLSLNQKNLVLSYFESDKYGKELQDKLPLLYFATLILNNRIKNPELEMPEEVIPIVLDIVKEITQYMKFYDE